MFNNQPLANYQSNILTAEQWHEFIKGGRNKISRTVANNTTVRIGENGGAIIKLHDTDIVTIGTKGRVKLDSGGWLSVTTKERINRYTNASISQRQGVWYMNDGSLFYDGMVINDDGTPVHPHEPTDYENKLRAIKKQAKEYAHAFVEELKAGNIGMPSAGDCWFCGLRGEDGKPLGELSSNAQHIRNHIAEKYYVPSLLVNAGRAAGYRDMQIGLMGIGGQRLFIDPEQNIYKYVVKQLQREL